MYKEKFNIWKEKNDVETFDSLDNYNKGEEVIYVNEFGVCFKLEILCFEKPVLEGRCVYLNKSSYWFPAKLSEIRKLNDPAKSHEVISCVRLKDMPSY